MKAYVLGFAFDEAKISLVLIKKEKPVWQKGHLNGVGGKVEATDRNIYHAMIREFYEETGLRTHEELWHHFADMVFQSDVMGGSAIVHCFRMFNNNVRQCKTTESEEVIHFDLLHPQKYSMIRHLLVLIPMAKDPNFYFCHINVV